MEKQIKKLGKKVFVVSCTKEGLMFGLELSPLKKK